MADRFYVAGELSPGLLVLTGDEAHHMSAVRRLQPGDEATLFNGDGREYRAAVVDVHKKYVVLEVGPGVAVDRELPVSIVVATAFPKGDRADYLLEKLVETGATRLIPLITARSVVHPQDAKLEKWQRAVIEASKQCGRNRLMAVEPPLRWDQLLARPDLPPCRFILHTAASAPAAHPGPVGMLVAVGPEGGFTPEEVEAALQSGWQALRLGPRVMRVETAAVAAVLWAACEAD